MQVWLKMKLQLNPLLHEPILIQYYTISAIPNSKVIHMHKDRYPDSDSMHFQTDQTVKSNSKNYVKLAPHYVSTLKTALKMNFRGRLGSNENTQ